MSAVSMLAILLTGATAQAPISGSRVLPGHFAAEEPLTDSLTFGSALRIQQVYSSTEFPPGPILIKKIYWRPCPTSGSVFQATVPDIQIHLSTTSKEPDQLSSTFADNIGTNDQSVFEGSLQLSSRFKDGPGGTKKFDMLVKLQHPFVYDPSQGNLLMDIRNAQGSTVPPVDAGGTVGDSGSRVVGLSPDATTANFSDTAVDIIKIVYKRANSGTLTVSEPKEAEEIELVSE